MLDQLEQLCDTLTTRHQSSGNAPVVFGWGDRAELNVKADEIAANTFLLFHDGYFTAIPGVTTSGHFVETHQLTLLLFYPSLLSDSPIEKRELLAILKPVYKAIYMALDGMGVIASPRATMNFMVNLTDRNLTGIQLTLSLTTNAESRC